MQQKTEPLQGELTDFWRRSY